MQVFHLKVFDDMVEGTNAVFSAPQFDRDLASVTSWVLVAIVSNISGTSPTLTISYEESADRIHWGGGEEIVAAEALTSGAVAMTGGPPMMPRSGFNRIRILLGGVTPKVHLTLWVTGRDNIWFPDS